MKSEVTFYYALGDSEYECGYISLLFHNVSLCHGHRVHTYHIFIAYKGLIDIN